MCTHLSFSAQNARLQKHFLKALRLLHESTPQEASLRTVRLQHLDGGFLLVLRGCSQRRHALSVRLIHVCTNLQEILQELLAAIAGCVVQPAVPGAVNGIRICPVVQKKLHHGDPVGSDGITERSDSLEVLRIQRLLLLQEALHSSKIPPLGSFVQGHCRVLNLLQNRRQLRRQATHLLADLQHQLLVLVVLHGSLHAVLLDVLKDAGQLRVLLQRLHAVRHRGVAVRELRVVVLGDGLSLQPASHGFRVFGKALQGLCSLRIAFHIGLHLCPGVVINVGEACDLHGGTIADLKSLSRSRRSLGHDAPREGFLLLPECELLSKIA
mmetsp:Transcript_21668/g.51518  ORF Transcript_21668/g.51518 Transcript_21668/m.51518 type:complete len:325 (+) Transcript_21668:58-1032(+)